MAIDDLRFEEIQRGRHDTRVNRILLAIILTCSTTSVGHADDRLWLDAKINGKPARLCFDSGSEAFILWRKGAERLGLHFTVPATNATLLSGRTPVGTTETCMLWLEGEEAKVRFRVAEAPSLVDVDCDGVIGWYALRHNVLQIDARARTVTFMSKVQKKKVAGWIKLAVVTNSGSLQLEIPTESGTNGTIGVDTGSYTGVDLPPYRWQEWKTAHPHQPTTFSTFVTPADGFVAEEEAWADHIAFGPLVLTNVPVTEATRSEVALAGPRFQGELGLAALNGLKVIIDGEQCVAYLQCERIPTPLYPHNRLGAAFVPATSQSDELIAQVADGSPAQEAGIRNGDILLKVDELDVSMSNLEGLRKFGMPPGTKLELTLKRDGKIFKTTAVLRNILPPDAPKNSN